MSQLVPQTFTGPALLKAGTTRAHDWNGTHSTAYDNWVDYVELAYGNTTEDEFHQAYATDIVEFYATKYGDQLDGWVSSRVRLLCLNHSRTNLF